MFILDSLMISGIRWVLDTVATAADAEMNDDSVPREQLLETEMRREMGEISEEEFARIEADLLARIREIKERREGGSGPVTFGAQPLETSPDSTLQIEASISGDFHDPSAAPHTTVVETKPGFSEEIRVLDMERSGRSDRSGHSDRSSVRSTRRNRTAERTQTIRTTRTTRTKSKV